MFAFVAFYEDAKHIYDKIADATNEFVMVDDGMGGCHDGDEDFVLLDLPKPGRFFLRVKFYGYLTGLKFSLKFLRGVLKILSRVYNAKP